MVGQTVWHYRITEKLGEGAQLRQFLSDHLLNETVGGIAAFLPARHAARVDPMVALRYE